MTLGDSGYCLGGYNAKSIDKSSLHIARNQLVCFLPVASNRPKKPKNPICNIAGAPLFFGRKYEVL